MNKDSKSIIANLKPYVFIQHKLMRKYKLQKIQYCIIDVISRLTQRRLYANIRHTDIAAFLSIKKNNLTYHLKKLTDSNIIEFVENSGFQITNDSIKKDFILMFESTFTVFHFPLYTKLGVSYSQYCILDSIYYLKYQKRGTKYEKTSRQKMAKNLGISESGFLKAINALENKLHLYCCNEHFVLSETVLNSFESLRMTFKK